MNPPTKQARLNEYTGAIICALAPVLCLAPFITRAFHIDDPLFLWTAQHIHRNPLDFYGFDVNWDGFIKTMAHENKNPPLTSYHIALIAAVAGWSETALHVGFLVPAALLGLGTYFLARRLCQHPVTATLVFVFTPALLVSGSSVMADVPMLTLFVWSIVLWLRGIDREDRRWLFVAGLLIAAAALTKYFGLALVPLLGIYSGLRLRKAAWWIAALLIPIAILTVYEVGMWLHYGTGGLFNAAGYAGASQTLDKRLIATLTGLTFTGACIASVVFFLPLLRIRYLSVLLAIVSVATLSGLAWLPAGRSLLSTVEPQLFWPIAIQVALFATAGIVVPALAICDVWKRRDSESTLLALWIAGTFLFAAYFNWSVTGRTILPMAPAAGILVARRLDTLRAEGVRFPRWQWYAPFVPSLLLALAVAWADARLANSAREMAERYGRETIHYPHNVFFQGHWGFQYYMEAQGAEPVAYGQTDFRRGDAIICPLNNTSVWPVDESLVASRFSGAIEGPYGLTTMSRPMGAGFYTDLWGPLPYVFGPVPGERYVTLVLNGTGMPFENVAYHE
jgi:hypothetical protein